MANETSVDLQQLRLFVQVSELNSFTEAAAVVGVAQPTVSRIIKHLEEEWGGRLFHRTPRGVTPTELGELALTRVRALLREVDQVSDDLRASSGQPSGTVALGLSPSLAPVIVPALVNELRREVPGIRLQVLEGFSNQVEDWRSSGVIDIGISSTFHEGAKARGAVFASQLVLAGSSHMPRLPSEVPFSDLARYPLVLPSKANGLRVMLDEVARRQGIMLDVVVETESIIAQKQICAHCGCYTIKAPEAIAEELRDGTYTAAAIVQPSIQRRAVMATTQRRPLSRAAREVAERMTELLGRLSPASKEG